MLTYINNCNFKYYFLQISQALNQFNEQSNRYTKGYGIIFEKQANVMHAQISRKEKQANIDKQYIKSKYKV